MNNLKSNNKGFSLVEILVALGISSVILLGVATFMRAGGNSYRIASTQSSLQNETQDIMNYLTTMVQASSDAGWQSGVLYVLQPDSLNATTSAKSIAPDFYVHVMKHDAANRKLYYKKQHISNSNFTLAKLNTLKTGLVSDANLISTKVTVFDVFVERYAASPTPKPDGSPGTDAPDSRTQSLSKIDIRLEIFNDDESKLTVASIRPRNTITSKYFHQVGFNLMTANAAYTPPSKVLARPNGDVEIGTDGNPNLR